MRTRFGTKVFVASVAAATTSLLVASLLLSWQVRERQRDAIERRLSDEARAVAEVISAESIDDASLDREADRVGRLASTSRGTGVQRER